MEDYHRSNPCGKSKYEIMEIFKYGIIFKNFDEIYLGRFYDLITNEQVIKFCQNKNILNWTEEDLINLIISEKESKQYFLTEISKLVDEKLLKKIFEVNSSIDFKDKNFRIWKLEYLLKALKEKNKEKVLEKVYEYFYMFQFPEDWNIKKIILYSHYPNGKPILTNDIYKNLIGYIRNEINILSKSHSS